jgi:glycosyltransferase involved in cell wall biosynthesis
VKRKVLFLDMSFTMSMFQERSLHHALDSRKLGGYFDKVISVHPLAGIFRKDAKRFGPPIVIPVDHSHLFVEGTVGISFLLAWFPALNFIIAQLNLIIFLVRISYQEKVNIVRIGDPYYLGIIGLLISRLLDVPLVIRVCFDYDLLYAQSGKAVFPRLFRFRFIEKIIERLVFARCTIAAGANQSNLEYAFCNGTPRDRGAIFRYGNLVDPAHFTEPCDRADANDLYKELCLDGPFLMTISRLEKMKQPVDNLYVLKTLLDAGKKIYFVYVGDGTMRQELVEVARSLDVVEYVRFTGNRTQDFIARLLPNSQLVLSPHMGRALTEACLAGAPIIAYDYDWQREIIYSGETGELVENGNWKRMAEKALWLLDNPEIALKYGRAARSVALEMMCPDRLNCQEIEVYDRLLLKHHRKIA